MTKDDLMYVPVPAKQFYSIFRMGLGIAFALGVWFTTIQVNQISQNRDILKNRSDIELLRKDQSDLKILVTRDLATIKEGISSIRNELKKNNNNFSD